MAKFAYRRAIYSCLIQDIATYRLHHMQSSPHLPEFPAILVFGLATSVETIHRILTRTASSLLSLEHFQTQHSTLTLAQIIKEVVMTSSLPFKLGQRTYRFLLQQFFCCTFSLTGLSRALQCAMLEHFHWQPLSVLCTENRSDRSKKSFLSHSQCEMVRATPSFQSHVESLSPNRQLALLEDDHKLELEVKSLISAIDSYHRCLVPLLACLQVLMELLPELPLGGQLYKLYGLVLEFEIESHTPFQKAWTLLGLLAQTKLDSGLSKVIEVLAKADSQPSCPSTLSNALSELRDFSSELKSLDELPLDTGTGVSGEAVPAMSVEGTTGERKMKLQERLRQLANRKREPSPYEKFRSKLLDYLHKLLTPHLRPPNTLALHEVFYYDHVSSLKKHLAPAPRASIQTALSRPDYYLTSASSVDEHTGLDANMPDICIVYQLHLECGRLINLYDWLQAFIAVVQPGTGQGEEDRDGQTPAKRRKKTREEVDPLVQARFIQAVSELQLLGFVKPTQRKTDHVQRLTWGAC